MQRIIRKLETETHTVYHNGNEYVLHSFDDEPAWINHKTNLKAWYKDGRMHRENGPAYIYAQEISWFFNDLKHREGGPASTFNFGGNEFYNEWYHHGLKHRIDGPACEGSHVSDTWYYNGNFVATFELMDWAATMGINPYLPTEDDKLVIMMKWGGKK